MTKVLLSIGHGYAADRIAAALDAGWRVIATTRREEQARALEARGIEAEVWDPLSERAPLALPEASHIVSSVAPVEGREPVVPALAAAVGAGQAASLRWIGYLSASSVYGDQNGAWVSEATPAAPSGARGAARLGAEEAWEALAASAGLGAIARFRIAAIYGPERSALEAVALGRARPVEKAGHWFNRIHVEDLGRIVAAAAEREARGAFILSDAEPAPQPAPLEFAAALMGAELPPVQLFDAAELSPAMRDFYSENKRLRSERLAELGLELRYPSYREGLAALWAGRG